MTFFDFNLMAPNQTSAVDNFGRTVANGWGSADTGGAWQIAGGVAADYSVGSGIGVHGVSVVNTTRRTLLPDTFIPSDVDLKVMASPTVLAASGNIESSLMIRIDPNDIGNTYYYGEIEFNYQASRTVRARIVRKVAAVDTQLSTAFDVPGLTYAANDWFWIRFQAIGPRLRLKVWKNGTVEPSVWTVTVTDTTLTSGRVGIRSTVDPGNTNTLPVNVNWDSFAALTNPANGFLVDEATQLNANWDKLDTRLTQFTVAPNTVAATIPVGTEALSSLGLIQVWDGTVWRSPDAIHNAWGSWTDIPLLAPVVERTGFTPKYRINTAVRKVELSGGLRADAAIGPWPRSKVQVSANTGGIPDANKPVTNTIEHAATGIGTVSGQYAGARIHIESNAGNSVKLSVSYQGDDIGGNFVMLDGIRWYY